MPNKVTIVAALFIHPGREAEFEQFESAAESIMRRYGGRLERRIGFPVSTDQSQPHEVHLVTFPDQASFEGYRADADLQALGELRTRAIRQTTAWVGSDLSSFIKG
jgi:antibiotic biosynthesis monooxygenase (ABM) superfamily enzyme